jgi:hypothetical protein
MLSVCSAHWRCRRRPFQVRSGSSLFFSNPFRLSLVCCAHWRHLADPRIDMILFIILSSLLAFWQARVKGHGETDRLERPQYVGRSRLLPGVVSGCQGRSRRGWSTLMNSLIGYRIYLLRRRHSPVRGSMNEHYLDEHCLGKRRKETFTRKISFRRRQDIHGEAVYQREPAEEITVWVVRARSLQISTTERLVASIARSRFAPSGLFQACLTKPWNTSTTNKYLTCARESSAPMLIKEESPIHISFAPVSQSSTLKATM